MTPKRLAAAVVGVAAATALWLVRPTHPTLVRDARPSAPLERAQIRHVRGPDVPSAILATQAERAVESPAADDGRGIRIEGQVLGPEGTPAGSAHVVLSTVPRQVAVSDADGSFAFDGLERGSYAVTAIAGELVGGPVPVQLGGHGEPVIVRLTRGGALTVEVRDEAGRAVAGARVDTLDGGGTRQTDDAGRATFRPVRPGHVGVEVTAGGHATGNATAAIRPGEAGAATMLTVTLARGFVVSGRVRDERGQPIAGAVICDAASVGGFGSSATRVTSDASGQFAFTLGPGDHTLLVRDGEHAPAASPPIAVTDRPVSGVDITMRAGGVIAGSVVTADATPVPGARVRVAGSDRGGTVMRELVTDEHGRFEARGLPRTVIHVQAQTDDRSSRIVDVDLAGTASAREVELVSDAGGAIEGVVVDDSGQRLAEIQVQAYRDATEEDGVSGMSSPAWTTTDGAGAFALRGLRVGTYRLFATGVGALRNPEGGTRAETGARAVRIGLTATSQAGDAPAGRGRGDAHP